jgi:hypothetical protein
MTVDSPDPVAFPNKGRSAVTNGSRLFLDGDIDGRSPAARRFRDLFHAVIADLGGMGNTSEGERQLARRAAALSVQCELAEATMAKGAAIDTEDYVRLVNGLNRTLGSIGLKRRARDVTPPDPLQYIKRQE